MTEELKDQCQDPTETLTVELPCQMLERIEKYAKKHKTNLTGVLIEALDNLLRKELTWR